MGFQGSKGFIGINFSRCESLICLCVWSRRVLRYLAWWEFSQPGSTTNSLSPAWRQTKAQKKKRTKKNSQVQFQDFKIGQIKKTGNNVFRMNEWSFTNVLKFVGIQTAVPCLSVCALSSFQDKSLFSVWFHFLFCFCRFELISVALRLETQRGEFVSAWDSSYLSRSLRNEPNEQFFCSV